MSTEIIASVIIPTYKRSALLLNALQSVAFQSTAFNFEVLVMDNGCDATLQIAVEQMAIRASKPVRYVRVPEIGLHNGRHAGVRIAQSETLVFVDDDIVANEGWLQSIVDSFNDPDVHLVGGACVPLYEDDPPAWMEGIWTRNSDGTSLCGPLSLLDYGKVICEIDPILIWGLNFAIRKNTLISLGGFHPDSMPWELRRFRGDGESAVSRAAKRKKLKALYNPNALVHHIIQKNRLSIEYIERRSYLQGISDSFTRFRIDNLNCGVIHSPALSAWKSAFVWLKRVLVKRLDRISLIGNNELNTRFNIAYQAGYQFHQNEVKADPKLLQWVLKKDYWNNEDFLAVAQSTFLREF